MLPNAGKGPRYIGARAGQHAIRVRCIAPRRVAWGRGGRFTKMGQSEFVDCLGSAAGIKGGCFGKPIYAAASVEQLEHLCYGLFERALRRALFCARR